MKLEWQQNNDFEYCRVVIPFPGFGKIRSSKDSPTTGEVVIREDNRALIWNIGTKFTGVNFEVALSGSIIFGEVEEIPEEGETTFEADPFLSGSNGHVKCEFCMTNKAHVNIESKDVSIYPKAPALFLCQSKFISGEYIIWNSYQGKPKYAFDPTDEKETK
eukprot:TRINITY_DN12773_c0_g1_i1.p1 TRINITY_DN12773_c0_g1~~TRINITY_DN12773_c0_g1_i1.p1  ORF type:complete len:161 (-),score=42.74 TRINITY_DN12773_c0_g1_i1:40-522(-)